MRTAYDEPFDHEPRTKRIESWHTHLTDLPSTTCGTARLVNMKYRGTYIYEKVDDYDWYYVPRWITIKALQRQSGPRGGWRTWMVDDPTHIGSMQRTVDHLPSGGVLCAGLGLGLMAHALVKREDISHITIIEISEDVIELIKPTLPQDARITIVCDDFYRYIKHHNAKAKCHSSILWDLGVGTPDDTREDFLRCFEECIGCLPSVELFQFGCHGQNMFTKWPEKSSTKGISDASSISVPAARVAETRAPSHRTPHSTERHERRISASD